MPRLCLPTVVVRDAYVAGELAMCAEEGTSTEVVAEAERDFESFVARRRLQRVLWEVPVTELWYVDGSDYIGTVILRHRVTPSLEVEGGHVGFHVIPRFRRQGHATQMLAAARQFARGMGLVTLRLTCAADNVASRRVIERNGGVLLDVRHGTARYEVAVSEGPERRSAAVP